MRGAPPVQVDCVQDARWLWFIRSLHASASASLAAWVAMMFDLRMPLSGVVVGLVAVLAWLVPPGKPSPATAPSLVWDGQRWLWQGQPAEVAVMLDFDRWLLLRVTSLQRRHWVPLSLSAGVPAAALFRAALQAHAGRARHADD